MTQPDIKVLQMLRREYSEDASLLIELSKTIAIHFQTISKANNYWV